MRPSPAELGETKTLIKKKLAEAVDLTDKGKNVVFFFKQLFKDEEPGYLQSLYFGRKVACGDDGKITVPISLEVFYHLFCCCRTFTSIITFIPSVGIIPEPQTISHFKACHERHGAEHGSGLFMWPYSPD